MADEAEVETAVEEAEEDPAAEFISRQQEQLGTIDQEFGVAIQGRIKFYM